MKIQNSAYRALASLSILIMACNNNGNDKIAHPQNDNSKDSIALKAKESKSLDEIKIGSQIWSAENLNVSTFRNGDPIPEAKTNEEWERFQDKGNPAWCYYNNDSSNGKKYGKLYNWFAVNDPRELTPFGWHVPHSAEWLILIDYLGGQEVAGRNLKAINGWDKNGNGTNISGFASLPGGRRSKYGDQFYSIGSTGQWWSSTEGTSTGAWALLLIDESNVASMLVCSKPDGLSVRCIRR